MEPIGIFQNVKDQLIVDHLLRMLLPKMPQYFGPFIA